MDSQITVFASVKLSEAVSFAAKLREVTRESGFITKAVSQGFVVLFNGTRSQLEDLILWAGDDIVNQVLTF